MPIIIAIGVGVLLLLVIYPNFSGNNAALTGNDNENEQADPGQEDSPAKPNTNVSVDVTTQVTDIVENVSHAVVGVTNIQTRADFWQQVSANAEDGIDSRVIFKMDKEHDYFVKY